MFLICTSAFGLAALAAPASAQTDMMAMQHDMMANQLGLMEYCQAQGYTDAGAVAAAHASVAALPPAASSDSMTAAEELGKKGTLAANGQSYTLASMASTHGTTESAMCKQMAQSTMQAQAMQHGAGMPAMPTPGSMPAMPAMPGMPAMPAMPTH